MTTYYGDDYLRGANLKEEMVGKPGEIAPAATAGAKMVTLWMLPRLSDSCCQFRPESISKLGRGFLIVFQDLPDFRRNPRMISDQAHQRPTARMNSS